MILFSLEQYREGHDGCVCIVRQGTTRIDETYPQSVLIAKGKRWMVNHPLDDDQMIAPSNLVGW